MPWAGHFGITKRFLGAWVHPSHREQTAEGLPGYHSSDVLDTTATILSGTAWVALQLRVVSLICRCRALDHV